ncbi:MAG: hypothetical protein CMM07_13215 [Rhodopirellula sp.]|nr:hypothetical protein [Rhodopirellula sp.]
MRKINYRRLTVAGFFIAIFAGLSMAMDPEGGGLITVVVFCNPLNWIFYPLISSYDFYMHPALLPLFLFGVVSSPWVLAMWIELIIQYGFSQAQD